MNSTRDGELTGQALSHPQAPTPSPDRHTVPSLPIQPERRHPQIFSETKLDTEARVRRGLTCSFLSSS
jgi:hypothetical protein